MKHMMTVGVFWGGKSPEHDISIITGELVVSGLKGLNYPVVPIYLDKAGRWYIGEELGNIEVFTKHQLDNFKNLQEYYLDLSKSQGKIVFKKKKLMGEEVTIDLAFPAFHGMNGEDGTIQGLFEIIGIPYVGCDVAASAITMDKVTTKLLYDAVHIPTVPFLFYSYPDWKKSPKTTIGEIRKKLKGNLFIKPARLGSSIGISKAHNEKELENSLEVAFHYEDKVIVEEAVDTLMDVTCCVIGNDDPVPSLLQESSFGKDFFSYEDKYLKGGGAQLGKAEQSMFIPARLDKKTTKEIQDTAVAIYKYIGCSGIARVDFLYDTKTKHFYANEINTLPGTLYHHLWKKSGVELPELLQKLIDYALARHDDNERKTQVFESSVLSQSSGVKLKK